MKEDIKIVIADDHPIVRKGLCEIIKEEYPAVLFQADNGEEALSVIEREEPDIAILDIDMPKMSGLEVAKVIQNRSLTVNVIIMTMYKEEIMFNKAMDAGVRGYVLKENAVSDIIQAIKSVIDGNYFISPSIQSYLLKRGGITDSVFKDSSGIHMLTDAEKRVLRILAEHKTSKEIAEELNISPKTIDRHKENISKKLNLHGTHALLKYAVENKSLL